MRILISMIVIWSATSSASIDKKMYREGDWESLKAEILARPGLRVRRISIDDVERLKSLRRLCDSQLKNRRVPASCFELIEMETKFGLLSVEKQKTHRERLNMMCFKNVKTIVDLNDSQFELNVPDSKCKGELVAQLERLKYGSLYRRPSEVFSARHRF